MRISALLATLFLFACATAPNINENELPGKEESFAVFENANGPLPQSSGTLVVTDEAGKEIRASNENVIILKLKPGKYKISEFNMYTNCFKGESAQFTVQRAGEVIYFGSLFNTQKKWEANLVYREKIPAPVEFMKKEPIYDQLFCEVGLFGPVAANRSPFLIYWNYESAVSKLKKQHSHLRNIPILKGKIQ